MSASSSPLARTGAGSAFAVSAIALDLDGTLLDTVHDLASAVNALLADLGHAPLPTGAIREMIGAGMPTLVRRALADATRVSPEAVAEAELDADGIVSSLAEVADLVVRVPPETS
jgi:phosphoglycolate phosphatase